MKLPAARDPFRVYIATCFFSQLFFTFVFTVSLLYQVQIVHLDPLQLVLVGTVLELSVFLFEIPTGIVSDLKSRKLSIIIGYTLIGLGFIVEGVFPFFTAVIIAQVLWGIGYTFTSGSQQAWMADEVGEARAAEAFIQGSKAGKLGQIIAIPASIAVGYFLTVQLPIAAGGFLMIGLALFLLLFMKEERFRPVSQPGSFSAWRSIKNSTHKIVTYSKASRIMLLLFLISLFAGFYSEGFDRLWITHLFDETGLGESNSSVLLAGGIQFVVVIISFGALQAVNRSRIFLQMRLIYIALFASSALIILSLAGFALSGSAVLLLTFYVLIQVSREVMGPLEDIWLNSMIKDSTTRATFFSVKGQVDAVGQIAGGPAIGMIAAGFSVRMAILASAVVFSPVLYLYTRVLKKNHD